MTNKIMSNQYLEFQGLKGLIIESNNMNLFMNVERQFIIQFNVTVLNQIIGLMSWIGKIFPTLNALL